MKKPLVTIVEHAHYLKRAAKLLTTGQMDEIADILAADPKTGDIMAGTGGIRKMRYAGMPGKGKSGGVRIIHLFITRDYEVHLLDIYPKNQQENLTKAERNELAKLAAILKGDRL